MTYERGVEAMEGKLAVVSVRMFGYMVHGRDCIPSMRHQPSSFLNVMSP